MGFCGANPLTESDRFYAGGIEVAARALASLLRQRHTPTLTGGTCESSLKGDGELQDLILPIPYYDAIPILT